SGWASSFFHTQRSVGWNKLPAVPTVQTDVVRAARSLFQPAHQSTVFAFKIIDSTSQFSVDNLRNTP
ncbi:MAG: hypothetical protein O2983_05025, partial [Planctomycetota bacterium]|nr:hypothetical protein [Planctomycetota bacterium]